MRRVNQQLRPYFGCQRISNGAWFQSKYFISESTVKTLINAMLFMLHCWHVCCFASYVPYWYWC